jgi:hypothetical protein
VRRRKLIGVDAKPTRRGLASEATQNPMTRPEASCNELHPRREKMQRTEAHRCRVYGCAYAHLYARVRRDDTRAPEIAWAGLGSNQRPWDQECRPGLLVVSCLPASSVLEPSRVEPSRVSWRGLVDLPLIRRFVPPGNKREQRSTRLDGQQSWPTPRRAGRRRTTSRRERSVRRVRRYCVLCVVAFRR